MFIKKKKFVGYKTALKKNAGILRRNMTAAERKLWYEYLRNAQYQFLKQKPIDKYIVDFYCAKLKLVIELDGDSHLDENGFIIKKDKIRDETLRKLGLRVLRFWNNEVFNSFNIVCERINLQIDSFNEKNNAKN